MVYSKHTHSESRRESTLKSLGVVAHNVLQIKWYMPNGTVRRGSVDRYTCSIINAFPPKHLLYIQPMRYRMHAMRAPRRAARLPAAAQHTSPPQTDD